MKSLATTSSCLAGQATSRPLVQNSENPMLRSGSSSNRRIGGSRPLQIDLALQLSRDGFPIFPVLGKAPITKYGHKDATTEEHRIRDWWRLHPNALVAIPTGSRTNTWVLDVDGALGGFSLRSLLSRLGVVDVGDLSPVIAETPSVGLHAYFSQGPGEQPRSRASDIGPGLDTRGEGGYIIAPGNVRPDGRKYRHIGRLHYLAAASEAPRELMYLATFNARERALIAGDARLSEAVRAAPPSAWQGVLRAHRQQEHEHLVALRSHVPDGNAMRRQALADLAEAANAYAALTDGRRNGVFIAACRLAKYVAHNFLSHEEVREAFAAAGSANGAVSKYGRDWIYNTIRRGLAYGAKNSLPCLARKYREGTQ